MNYGEILLVEDNPDDEELTLLALARSKLQTKISVARDGVEALDFLFGRGTYSERKNAHLPQVVFLDLKLPKVDGIEVLHQIRSNERTKRLPVVILTSSKEQHDVTNGYDHGANSYIVKPVDTQQFMDSIAQLGCYWIAINQVEIPIAVPT